MQADEEGRLSPTNLGTRVESKEGVKKVAVSLPKAVSARRGSWGLRESALMVVLLTR